MIFPPEITKTIASDDKPCFTSRLEKLKSRKIRELNKHKKSEMWKVMIFNYEFELSFFTKIMKLK